ncbi:phosphoribosylglycinamide formyltransferase [Sediminitomix flava]|uniref:Phosphoribosylglycinamide formyltransferase n=1 Tax=Sediminitomix flava TaxID=379075 RepID=A0A315Z9Z2_SEDFL|nr:phosphoribosylglycinamide formyltransferase [Sediminitomix flava]PWJ42396.1 formyltetrahydrofolate-dependent phosphoribosylglycinamide formyltransferase [Sediminitomix flava]
MIYELWAEVETLKSQTNVSEKKVAILASGSGSNAENIIQYFRDNNINASFIIIANNKEAKVFDRAERLGVPSYYFGRKAFNETGEVKQKLIEFGADLIVLAGFLWLIPSDLVEAYPNKIVNIHPALLPKYGGKGMYGINVHRAVVEAKEKESGITIHYCNQAYDEGAHILQASCLLDQTESPEEVAKKVLRLEHKYYPQVVEDILFNS